VAVDVLAADHRELGQRDLASPRVGHRGHEVGVVVEALVEELAHGCASERRGDQLGDDARDLGFTPGPGEHFELADRAGTRQVGQRRKPISAPASSRTAAPAATDSAPTSSLRGSRPWRENRHHRGSIVATSS
jgi:hypothetical protein